MSQRLPYKILTDVNHLAHNKLTKYKVVNIFSDSQAGIKAIEDIFNGKTMGGIAYSIFNHKCV